METIVEYGYYLARARKAGRCDCVNCPNCGGPGHRCKHVIQPREQYVSGELNDRAGGYGKDRYCLACMRSQGFADIPPEPDDRSKS